MKKGLRPFVISPTTSASARSAPARSAKKSTRKTGPARPRSLLAGRKQAVEPYRDWYDDVPPKLD